MGCVACTEGQSWRSRAKSNIMIPLCNIRGIPPLGSRIRIFFILTKSQFFIRSCLQCTCFFLFKCPTYFNIFHSAFFIIDTFKFFSSFKAYFSFFLAFLYLFLLFALAFMASLGLIPVNFLFLIFFNFPSVRPTSLTFLLFPIES